MQNRQGQRDKVSKHFTTSKHFCRQPKTLVNAVFPDPALQKEKLRQRFFVSSNENLLTSQREYTQKF